MVRSFSILSAAIEGSFRFSIFDFRLSIFHFRFSIFDFRLSAVPAVGNLLAIRFV